MDIDPQEIRQAVKKHLDEARRLLCDLIATPSLSGNESAAMDLAADAFAKHTDVTHVEMTNSLRQDKDYSDPVGDIDYTGRYNLRAAIGGTGGGRSLLLNTHLDTVPPGQGQDQPYEPLVRDGLIFGRGSCDAKGQVASIYLAMAALRAMGVRLDGDLIAHLVTEEEVGGNGSLAMVRAGEKTDGCIILEPTDLKILTSIRGAVWFRIMLQGRSGHSGQAQRTKSALDMAITVIDILRDYHDRLLGESRGDPLFDKFPNPMPLTIGALHAGNWPATAPGEAVLEGVLGLLPNKTAQEVMDEMRSAIATEGGLEISENCDIHFTYRHDSSVVPVDHPLVKSLQAAANQTGHQGPIAAMPASCDAWFYNNQLKIPTVVFGAGSLGVAHSNNEHISLNDIAIAAEILANTVIRWCGASKQ